MKVLVDTSIWSLALRRRPSAINKRENQLTAELEELIREGRTELLGPVRQELLSGIKDEAQFERIRRFLQAFPDPSLEPADYEQAGRLSNDCRSRGVAGTSVDMLLCAVAIRRGWALFTADRDFVNYEKVISIRLHHPRAESPKA